MNGLYLVGYNFGKEPMAKIFDEKDEVKRFLEERKNLVEFSNFKVYKLCNDEFLD